MRHENRISARLVALAAGFLSLPALAQTNVDASMTVDNQFTAYLSTSDAVQGTQIGTGNDWQTTYQFSSALTPGVTNYLHIVGTDTGPPAAFIGQFSLDGNDFEFANGTQSLLTNTSNWQVSTTGFGANYQTPSDLGPDGTGPWGNRPSINDSARFIWHPAGPGNTVYFSTTIVPTGASETRATFTVTKDFTDGNPNGVEVTLSCNTGLPLDQSKVIDEGSGVEFVVVDFDSGEMDCEVTEENLTGYDAVYNNGPGNSSTSCEYTGIEADDEFDCHITNTPEPVDIDIAKEWVFEGSSDPDGIDTRYELTLYCNAEIVDGHYFGPGQEAPSGEPGGPSCGLFAFQESPQFNGGGPIDWCKTFYGDGPGWFNAEVIPEYPSSHCYVVESLYDSAVEVDNGCGYLVVSAGEGDSCTIVNTVFFEGIPALNPYGLALLALTMLGIGFVGFRRFA